MDWDGTLLITRQEVAGLLEIGECMDAVEQAFGSLAEGKVTAPGVLGIHVQGGGFHTKAGAMHVGRHYFVVKTNANFPGNRKTNGLPTIQGIVAVSDADNGRLLAIMDSIELTIVRTGAATGIAAKYLSRRDSRIATICGCGNQGRISIVALLAVRNLDTVYVYDSDHSQAEALSREMSGGSVRILPVEDFRPAVAKSDICVTCTTATKAFLGKEHIRPGTFIAAVGADSDTKHELEPSLLASSKIVVDLLEQSATIGDLHHALVVGLLKAGDVYATLGEIIAGRKPGRTSDEEVIVFDSTGMALQDVAAASIVYEKALASAFARKLNFS